MKQVYALTHGMHVDDSPQSHMLLKGWMYGMPEHTSMLRRALSPHAVPAYGAAARRASQ